MGIGHDAKLWLIPLTPIFFVLHSASCVQPFGCGYKREEDAMHEKIEFDEKVIEILRKKMEVRHNMNLSDCNQYQIIELWVNLNKKF